MHIPINTIIFLAVLAGIILLQVFLSKQESKWPGLVIPVISFLFSLIYPLNMTFRYFDASVFLNMLMVLLLANIPTYVLLAIYFGCRSKGRRNTPIDKMNIQDLD